MLKLKLISGHLSQFCPSESKRDLVRSECGSAANPDDMVVVHGLRTAITKAKSGAFKDTTPDEMLSAVMTAVLTQVRLPTELLGDFCVESVPVYVVNRQCLSGLQALLNIAGAIRSRTIDMGLACGVESMSLQSIGNPGDLSSRLMDNSKARDCIIPMGITSEKVAEKFQISREKQDVFAQRSQLKATWAQSLGLYQQEIIPVTTKVVDADGTERLVTVSQDDGIRGETSLARLAKLPPAFKPGGSTTAGLGVDDVDVFEINKAFASQAMYCVEMLGIPLEKVNPNGGAIALGHLLGCTGARQVVTLLNELQRRRKMSGPAVRAYGVVSMCIGTGMGAAAVFEYPGPAQQ